jgi:hypothetical protein
MYIYLSDNHLGVKFTYKVNIFLFKKTTLMTKESSSAKQHIVAALFFDNNPYPTKGIDNYVKRSWILSNFVRLIENHPSEFGLQFV